MPSSAASCAARAAGSPAAGSPVTGSTEAGRPGVKGDLGGNPGIQSAVITSGQFRLRAEVPDDLFSLAVEDDDEAAGIAHAAFVDRWLPEDAPPGTRERMLAQLAVARRALAEGGVSYL